MKQDCPPAPDRMVCVLRALAQVEHVAELVRSDELAGDALDAFLLGFLSIVVEQREAATGTIDDPSGSKAWANLTLRSDEKIFDLVPRTPADLAVLKSAEKCCYHVEDGRPVVPECHIGSGSHEKKLVFCFCVAGVGREGRHYNVCESGEVVKMGHFTVAGWRVDAGLF